MRYFNTFSGGIVVLLALLTGCSSDSGDTVVSDAGTSQDTAASDGTATNDGSAELDAMADSGPMSPDVSDEDTDPSADAADDTVDAEATDTTGGAEDTMSDTVDDAAVEMDTAGVDDTASEDVSSPDAEPATTATIVGSISRSTDPGRGNDGAGDVFIALFDQDPITNRSQTPAGAVIIPAVDLSADGASVAYSFPDVVPRAQPYFISAFMDDNGNASASLESAGPDRGDLVMLQSFLPPASKQVTVAAPGEVVFDVDFDQVLPF